MPFPGLFDDLGALGLEPLPGALELEPLPGDLEDLGLEPLPGDLELSLELLVLV